VAVIGVGHYRATLSPNSMRILPDENQDNGAVRDPNRDIAEGPRRNRRPPENPGGE
jgi:hypothetical protein